MRKSMKVFLAVGLAIALSVPILGLTFAQSSGAAVARTSVERGDPMNVTLLPPLMKRTSWYGGAVIPVRVLVSDPDDNSIIANATVTLWVNDMPAASPGAVNMGNNFTYMGDGVYQFNLNTKPYPAGPGSAPIKLTIGVLAPGDRAHDLEVSISLR